MALYRKATTLRKEEDIDIALNIAALLYKHIEVAIIVRSRRLYNAHRCKTRSWYAQQTNT
jgi:hypothetical protein